MPSDLTPEQREAAVDAMVQAYDAEFNHTNNAFRRPMRAALTALLAAGWRPAPQPAVRGLDGWPHAGGGPIIPLEYPAGDPPAFFETTDPAHPDAISAAEARGRREGIEAAKAEVLAVLRRREASPLMSGAEKRTVADIWFAIDRALSALSSIPPQEADPT